MMYTRNIPNSPSLAAPHSCLDLNNISDGSGLLTLAFDSETDMTQFYKLALKSSLIMTPPAPFSHSELLSLMFRNSPEVRDR
jgi:hypothetical protein